MEEDQEPDLWCVIIRWSGPRPTPKEVGLLWKITPLRSTPLPEVLQLLKDAPEWKEERLFTAAAQQLRQRAEALGFQVELVPEIPVPKLAPPGSGVTQYCVQFRPSFHEAAYVLVTLGPEGDSVSIVSKSVSETVALPTERGRRFLDEVAAVDALGIPNGDAFGIDGITVHCHIQQENGRRTFKAWGPSPRRTPRQHGFVMALYRLATDLARKPETVLLLEQLFGYIVPGLCVKVFNDEVPRRIRLFGRISVHEEEELEALFASIPPGEPVLMDLTGFVSMGTVLYPYFERFHARPGRTGWWVNPYAFDDLKDAGLPAACLHLDREAALASLQHG